MLVLLYGATLTAAASAICDNDDPKTGFVYETKCKKGGEPVLDGEEEIGYGVFEPTSDEPAVDAKCAELGGAMEATTCEMVDMLMQSGGVPAEAAPQYKANLAPFCCEGGAPGGSAICDNDDLKTGFVYENKCKTGGEPVLDGEEEIGYGVLESTSDEPAVNAKCAELGGAMEPTTCGMVHMHMQMGGVPAETASQIKALLGPFCCEGGGGGPPEVPAGLAATCASGRSACEAACMVAMVECWLKTEGCDNDYCAQWSPCVTLVDSEAGSDSTSKCLYKALPSSEQAKWDKVIGVASGGSDSGTVASDSGAVAAALLLFALQ